MPLKTIKGFQLNTYSPEKEFLILESRRLDECLAFLKTNKLYGVSVQRHMVQNGSFQTAFDLDTLECLKKCPDLKGILITDKFADISAVHTLSDLRYLCVSENRHSLDLGAFPKLEEASLDWHPKLQNLDACLKLRTITLGKFNPKTRDFTALPPLKSVRQLSVVQSTIISLAGVDRLLNIERLGVWHGPKLVDIGPLNAHVDSLKSLRFDTCRRINNLSVLPFLVNLSFLGLNNCGKIESISFIRSMKNLKIFTFVGTNVEDGDLSPCKGLSYAGFLDKRHYSHKHDKLAKHFTNEIPSPWDDWGNPIPQEYMAWLRNERSQSTQQGQAR